MLFPMYTIPADVLLQMTEIKPHEELLATGEPSGALYFVFLGSRFP